MNDKLIKDALAYSLGSDMHDVWRNSRKQKDGTFLPRIKTTKDEEWKSEHNTDQVDIANCSFSELPTDWQFENLEAARVAIELVYDKAINGDELTKDEVNLMASHIHDEWLKRNTWVYDPNYGDPSLTVSFQELSKEEQAKDLAQLKPAYLKVYSYREGLINIDQICNQYGISELSKKM